jgi:aspartyl-tRNA(Asn)/glutamyl-tRNA(Gln) amidotransferase subunit B
VLNKKVVEFAIAAGLALNCEITQRTKFDRKNYFYPDLPKAYQISQLYLPICRNGYAEIETNGLKKKIRIHEIHMEEDAGKLIHDPWEDMSLVDYNRCGVPLIEIVSEPDMRDAADVEAYLEKLRSILQYLGVSDCKMQEGSMRADVNLSVRPSGSETFGTRTEMKNMNSLKAIGRAVEGERKRQVELIGYGKHVIQETRRWDDNKDSSFAMRSKEDAKDYRYFPEPDLVPVSIDDAWIDNIRTAQPELREEKVKRYINNYSLPPYDAQLITLSKHIADIFEAATELCGNPKEVSNWIMGDVMRHLKETQTDPDNLQLSAGYVASFVKLIDDGRINRTVAKDVFEQILKYNAEPVAYVEKNGLGMVSDDGAIRELIKTVIADNPQSIADYKAGKEKALGFLVGSVMKQMKGKADPALVNAILREEI